MGRAAAFDPPVAWTGEILRQHRDSTGSRFSPTSHSEEEDSGQEKFNKCIGADYSGLTKIGDAESKDFATGESTEASSDATIFKSDQQAEDGMSELAAGMSGSATEDCFQDLVEEGLKGEKGYKLGEIDVGELSFTPPNVEEAKAWQIVVPVEATSGAGKDSP